MGLRRWFQFRLRTLLIAATLLCITLVIFVLPARQKWQAIRELQKQESTVSFEEKPSPWQEWSRDRLGCDWGPAVNEITQQGVGALTERDRRLIAVCQPRALVLHSDQLRSEQDRAWVARLPSLQSLSLHGWPTEAQLLSLQPAPRLKQLILFAPPSDAGWRALASLTQVRKLHLWDCPLSAEGLAQLVTMRHLQELEFIFSTVTDEQLAQLRAALPECLLNLSE